MTTMQPLPSKTVLIDQVRQTLQEAIASGQLKPGERLAQEALADQLGISRQPISHALALLKQEGFLVESGRRGLEVAPIDAEYLQALYEVRAPLDGEAARRATIRIAEGEASDEHKAAVERALAEGWAALEAEDLPALLTADVAFHRALVQLSGNPVLLEISERQWPHLRRAMIAVLEKLTKKQVWEEHAAIWQAVLAGDPKEAEWLARAHVEQAGRKTYKALCKLVRLD
ncbi:GntR family transcriptional regulator [Rhodovibrionaceae bacterium A322]